MADQIVTVLSDCIELCTGFASDWEQDYQISGDSECKRVRDQWRSRVAVLERLIQNASTDQRSFHLDQNKN